MPEKKIVIIEDVDGVITFDKVETERDTINRADVESAEKRIAEIEAHIIEENKELEALREQIAYAKEIIALADKKKEEEMPKEDTVEEPVVADTEEPSVEEVKEEPVVEEAPAEENKTEVETVREVIGFDQFGAPIYKM